MPPKIQLQTIVVINRSEWLNLCALGEIRLNRKRLVETSSPPKQREMDKAFALSPQSKVDSSIDVFMLEIRPDWATTSSKHPAGGNDIRLLRLADVVCHRTAASEHFPYYRDEGDRYGVHLAPCDYESHWVAWCTSELVRVTTTTAAQLARVFVNSEDPETPRLDRYKWSQIGELLLRPKTVFKAKPAHVDNFVKSWLEISDQIAETRDLQSFHIAASIVWIEIRTKKQPQQLRRTSGEIKNFLEVARTEQFAGPSENTRLALEFLHREFPKAFTAELTPFAVSALVEILRNGRSGDLSAERGVEILHSVSPSPETLRLVCFAMTLVVGVERVNGLIRSLGFANWVSPGWEHA